MPTIVFINEQKTITVDQGKTILEAARLADVTIESPCNANGSCGKCTVHISAGKNIDTVLACQHKIQEDLEVRVKDYSGENKSLQILTGGSSFIYENHPFITKVFSGSRTEVYGGGKILGVEEGDTTGSLFGLAVDIGTTTLVTALVDLKTGKTVASESALNPQAAYAQDVLGRIHFAAQEDGLATLYQAFSDALEAMIHALTQKTGVSREHIYEAVYSGNTTMLHLACKVDPASLGQFPYTPKLTGGEHRSAENLRISPFGLIWLPPVISAYVGADISSGILASRLDARKGSTIFIDIGTNGEMVLARDGVLAASSTAAGPAFEGMNISCGMRASRGAIEAFSIDGEAYSYEVIGSNPELIPGEPITGICGSGLLDIAGELVRVGLIGKNGRFINPEKGNYGGALARSMRPLPEVPLQEGTSQGKSAFFITDEVYLAQKDIRQIQLAKGAIRCGIEMLLARFGMTPGDVDAVEIAGSFGYHLKESSLLNIGLLPPEFAGKVAFVGNTSLIGGIALLMNTEFRSRIQALVRRVDPVELSNDSTFERTFIQFLSF